MITDHIPAFKKSSRRLFRPIAMPQLRGGGLPRGRISGPPGWLGPTRPASMRVCSPSPAGKVREQMRGRCQTDAADTRCQTDGTDTNTYRGIASSGVTGGDIRAREVVFWGESR